MRLQRAEHVLLATAALASWVALGAPAGTSANSAAATDKTESSADIENCRDPLCLNASHLEYTPNHLILREFDIVDTTRGTTHVKGDLAEGTGRDSKNSTWVLTGHVQLFMPQGHLSAERATMQIVDNRITTMTAQGSPAEFESSADPAGLNLPTGSKASVAAAIEHAHGHAQEIIYSLEHNELQLNGDSWLSNGCNEISSQHIAYDIASQKVHAETNPGDKVRIHRRGSGACSAEADKP
jgi:lipopolysaccharide transport protein LptA